MSDEYDFRNIASLQDPHSFALTDNGDYFNPFNPNEYFEQKHVIDKMIKSYNRLNNPDFTEDDNVGLTQSKASGFLGCTKATFEYLWALFKNLVFKTPVPDGIEPSWKCILYGTLGIAVFSLLIIAVVALVGPEILGGITVLAPIATILQGIISQAESFIDFIAQYSAIVFYFLRDGWRTMIDFGSKLSEFIANLTGAYPPIVLLNFFTLVLWGLLQLLLEIYEVELDWKDSEFYNFYKFFDWPIDELKKLVEQIAGKGIVLDIVRFFAVPFELGVLLISLLVGGIWILTKEGIAILIGDLKSKKQTGIN